MPKLNIDFEYTQKIIERFIKSQVKEAHLNGGVIGLSGGLDSAVTLYLTVSALGKENVYALILPYKTSNPQNIEDAHELVSIAGVKAVEIDITNLSLPYFSIRKKIDNHRKGNFLARLRMTILYDFSKELDYMVIGTGNKSERLMGYTTLWGDMACGIAPIADLYKTQVKKLAKHLGVPEKIINKTPSADLWEGQTDEEELGITYARADMIFYMFYDLGWSRDWILAEGFSEKEINHVGLLFKNSEFKRVMPPYPKIITSSDE